MERYRLGIDVGSTTVKAVLMRGEERVFSRYERHRARIRQTLMEMLHELEPWLEGAEATVAVSGSAGMGLAREADFLFVQEVFATAETVRALAPDTGTVIELGGEDAKVIFLQGGLDERMNGSCAGGTGAFIDQMAVLLGVDGAEMDRLALRARRIYPIASRCGVFAKSDIQPLLNQGAEKADVAASIYQAVVNQTIAGLIQGREISGKVMFLGGPLHYCQGLRRRFTETLGLGEEEALFPEWGRFGVAIGAAMLSGKEKAVSCGELITRMEHATDPKGADANRLPPLFRSREEYLSFTARHSRATVPTGNLETCSGDAWLGIDCGSTTTKLVLIGEKDEILFSYYSANQGSPVTVVREQLMRLRTLCAGRIRIRGTAVTGYGEDLIRHAFRCDEGLVETMAHFTAARHFCPEVDFILDIGGQDIKCFRIRGGAIDSIMLNEACSSGCGSFLSTFASGAGCSSAEFAAMGLMAASPVNLGSRCTVFMNSSVKQAQKDGAPIEDISAGLSISVVKNAVYKVIRANSPEELGEHIVVQGGTFLSDAVLRAFEMEMGREVIRPAVAGLMGAYGAALDIKKKRQGSGRGKAGKEQESSLLTLEELEKFQHRTTSAVCRGCANGCHLTINHFEGGGRYVSGNQCEKGAGIRLEENRPNMMAWKRAFFEGLKPGDGSRGTIGLPMGLGMYELAPLWHGILTALGFRTAFSGLSTRKTYEKGQLTIPSDTACYPAKLMHGHVAELLEAGIRHIFYPGLSYNVDEKAASNHFNCPLVAYYGELLKGNIPGLRQAHFMEPFLLLDNEKTIARGLTPVLREIDGSITEREVRRAAKQGLEAYRRYTEAVHGQGEKVIREARKKGQRIMVLAGRPYHVDPEISHGIDQLAASLGFAVVTEDSVAHLAPVQYVKVLDQWTFHARLYRAAAFACANPDVELVQLVSFGCGIDAITSDEVRDILERNGKHYTQLKIDEISNLGAVRIRLRSLLGALEAEGGE